MMMMMDMVQAVPHHIVQMAAMFYLFARLRMRMTKSFFACSWPTNCSYGVLEAAIVLKLECPWAVDMFLSAKLVNGIKCQSGVVCPPPPLLMAAGAADTALACKLMAAGADPRCTDDATDLTALHGATLIDARECIELLANDRRTNIGAVDKRGNTAAHYLCSSKAAQLLISALVCRGELPVLGIRNTAGETAIISAIRATKNLAVVGELLAVKFGVTTLDNNGDSILHHLVAYTNDNGYHGQATAKLLLTHILNTHNSQDIHFMCAAHTTRPTPMGLAMVRGRMDLVELFSSRGHAFSNADFDALHITAELARGAHTAAFSDMFKDVPKTGLDATQLAALPRITLTAKQLEQHKTCTICYDEFEAGATVILLHCAHAFHEPCLKRWLKNNTTCPLCRAKLDTAATKE